MKELWEKYKTEIIAGGIILILILIFVLYIYFKDDGSGNDGTGDNSNQTAPVNESNLSYPINDYRIYADQLQEAMGYLGTDEDIVWGVMEQLNNADDLRQLLRSFGKRQYYLFWGDKTLPQWFVLEFEGAELDRIRGYFTDLGVAF